MLKEKKNSAFLRLWNRAFLQNHKAQYDVGEASAFTHKGRGEEH